MMQFTPHIFMINNTSSIHDWDENIFPWVCHASFVTPLVEHHNCCSWIYQYRMVTTYHFMAWLLIGWQHTLQLRHNDHNGISNHQPYSCLLNRLFRHRLKKTAKLHVTGLCGEFTSDRWISCTKAENVSIWWRRHGCQRISSHVRQFLFTNMSVNIEVIPVSADLPW